MELLRNLYAIHSPSNGEKKMRKFIKDWIKRNAPDATIAVDDMGNVYAVRGEAKSYPCVVAHMDQVQEKHGKDFRCYIVDGKVYGFSPSVMEMRGLGADDKNGIWVALNCLKKYEVMKVAFFVGEEIGCVGSSRADMEFFKDCRWVIQCDRKNGGDLITNASGTELCSRAFVDAIAPERFGYKEVNGLMTDVMTLKEEGLGVSCVNLSCGYYNPHTDGEYTDIKQLKNCKAFVEWIIENVTDVYPHDYVGWDGWNDDKWFKPKDEVDDATEIICDLLYDEPWLSDEELIDEVSYFVNLSREEIKACIESCRCYFDFDYDKDDN